MKTNKLILAVLLLIGSCALFGQINPINDLFYQQTYSYGNSFCPGYNCFELSWAPPDSSNDTLLGYNIYRNNDLWLFTGATQVNCSGQAPCEYNDFYDPLSYEQMPFWVTVKALYNNDSIISVANDSICVNDLMTNIDKVKRNKIELLKNPISMGENISILIPDSEGENCKIYIYSLIGQVIKEYEVKQVMNGVISISTNKMPRGLYIINIHLSGQTINKKILIQ